MRRAILGLALFAFAASASASPFGARHGKHPAAYPAYVVAADATHGDQQLHAVWDLFGSAGSRIAKASLTPIASASRPAGVSAPSAGAVGITATAAMSGIDFSGNTLFVSGNGTAFTLTDGWLGISTNSYQIRGGIRVGGVPDGPSSFDLEHVTVDMQSVPFGGNLDGIDGSSVTVNYGRILNAPRDPIVVAGGTSVISNTLVGAFATNTTSGPSGDHNEGIYQIDGGTITITHTIVDMSYGNPFTGGFTGLTFLRAQTSSITAHYDHDILRGESTISAPYTMQMKAVGGDVTADFANNIVELGASAFNGTLAFDCHTITWTDGGGNFDTNSNPVTLSGFIRAPGLSGTPASTGNVGVAYSFTPTAACTPVPATGLNYFTSGGALPPGLSVNGSTGVISGTPTTPGTYAGIFLKAQVSAGNTGTLGPFTITIS